MNHTQEQKSKAEDVLTHLDMSLDEMIASHHATQRQKQPSKTENSRTGNGRQRNAFGSNTVTARKGTFDPKNRYLNSEGRGTRNFERRGNRLQGTSTYQSFEEFGPGRRGGAFQPYSSGGVASGFQRPMRNYTSYGPLRYGIGGNTRARLKGSTKDYFVEDVTFPTPRRSPLRHSYEEGEEDVDLVMYPERRTVSSRNLGFPSKMMGGSIGSMLQQGRRRNHPLKAALIESRLVAISGLDYSVMTSDLEELFLSVGPVEKCWIDYDRTDRSLGTGGVIFYNQRDAFRAIEIYNGRLIDSQPLQLELVAQ